MGLLNFLTRALSPERELARVERALDQAKEKAGTEPKNAEVWRELGDLNLRIGLVGSASQSYQTAVNLFLSRNEREKALAVLQKLVLFNFFDLPVFERIFVEQGMRDVVIALYESMARRLKPSDESYAGDIFRRILSIDPLHGAALEALGAHAVSGLSGAVCGQEAAPQAGTPLRLLAYHRQETAAGPLLRGQYHDSPANSVPEACTSTGEAAQGADIESLLRENMEQQRETISLLENLLSSAMKDALAASESAREVKPEG